MAQNQTPGPSSPFEITRRDPAGNASGTYPSAVRLAALAPATGATVAVRGLALTADDQDPTCFIPSGPTSHIGHLTRDVVKDGATLADRVFGRTTTGPTGIAGPFTAGSEVSVEKAHEIEAEDPLILLSGARAITAATAPGSRLTFEDGKVALWLSGDQAFMTLTANNLQTSTASNTLRIRAERL